jgi:hypothetical protein
MVVLVTGSRDWETPQAVYQALDKLVGKITKVIQGGAQGADCNGVECHTEHADWATHGKKAGPIRNQKMVDMKPDLVLAFSYDLSVSRGTADCVRRAKAAGITVEVYPGEDQ